MAAGLIYSILKKKYYCLLVLAVFVNTALALCEITDQGKSEKISYKDENDCQLKYYNWERRRECATKSKTVWLGPTTFYCRNSTFKEMYSSNNDKNTQNHFIVTDSFLNSLVADGKTWPGLTELTLDNTNISTIIPGFFNGFTKLSRLSIVRNNIVDIVDGVFSSLENLQNLNLSQNSISHLGLHSFLGLSKLNLLDLSRNKIVDLPKNIFLQLNSLNHLDLSKNELTQLRNNLNLSSLKKVYLKENDLTEFDFFHVTKENLEILDISQNKIKFVDNLDTFQADAVNLAFNNIESFQKIGQIRSFNISHNRLKILQDNFVSSSVSDLDLSFNIIYNISSTAFAQASILTTLHLNHNNIKLLPPTCFQNLKILKYLDLSFNNLSHSEYGTFNNLKNLKHLNMSHNDGLIDFHIFLRSSLLESLDFEKNYVKNLDEFFLKTHGSLKHITMGQNLWNCSQLAQIIHLIELRNITVTEGQIHQSSNVHGIGCSSGFETTLTTATINTTLDENKTEVVNNLFNDEFKNISIWKYFKDIGDKFLEILNDTEKNIGNGKMLSNNVSFMESLIKLKKEETFDNKDSYFVYITVFSNILLLFIVCSLVVIIRYLKKQNIRTCKEEVELMG